MPNSKNLKSWKPGQSGNPTGKPKGTKHLSTWIRELMEDESFSYKLSNGKVHRGAPIKAVLTALIIRALEGDTKAFDLLAKYGYGTKFDISTNNQPLPIPIFGGLSTKQYVKNVDQVDL